MLSLDISIFPVDSDTGLPVLSASVSVIIVSSESVHPLITGVAVNSVLGMAEVKIPFETSFLLVVQAPSYSTVSRPYYSYCSTGSPKCLPFTSNLTLFIGHSIFISLKRRLELHSISYDPLSSFSLALTEFSLPLAIHFPPDALDVPTGTSLVISLNVIDPFDGVTLAPQLFAERLLTDERTYLDSLALSDIVITNAETNETVTLKRSVELVFQLNDTANVTDGDLIPAWSFNEERGIWIEEGFGVVSLSPRGDFSWSFNASHLSWWNCDRPWTDKNCIHVYVGHIQNGEAAPSPLSGALVSVDGHSYNYYAETPTAPTGETCLEAKRGELSAIRVIHSLFDYESDEVLVYGSPSSSVCALNNSLRWTPNLAGVVGGECEEVNILCKNEFALVAY